MSAAEWRNGGGNGGGRLRVVAASRSLSCRARALAKPLLHSTRKSPPTPHTHTLVVASPRRASIVQNPDTRV